MFCMRDMSEPGTCHQKSLCAVTRDVLRWSQGWGTQPAGGHFSLLAQRMRETPCDTVMLPASWLDLRAGPASMEVWLLDAKLDSSEVGVVGLTAEAGAVSAWAVGMSSVSTTRVVGLAFLLVLRRRRLTHHPHGTRSHGVGLVRKDMSGGIRVMTSIRAGMAGARRLCR